MSKYQISKREASDAGLMNTPPSGSSQIFLARIVSGVSGIDKEDASARYNLEAADNKCSSLESSNSSVRSPEQKIISWHYADPQNPYNWSTKKKVFIVFVCMVVVVNSTMGSSLPSNAIPIISAYFHVTNSDQQILTISIYLVGYVLGPLLFGPLSEVYGRKIIMILTFFLFTVFTMACALAPNFAMLLVFRLLVGINASSPISVTGGIYADIYNDPVTRGRAMAVFMGGTCVGPLVTPILSGFVAPALDWRWVFWIGLIFAGLSWIPLLFLPETYGPVLLSQRAAKLRLSTGNPNIFSPLDLETKGWKQMATVTLTRPLRMLFFEPIVLATCLYLSLIYGIFYMYFEAYPLIFQGVYKLSPGVAGFAFLPIGAGALIATAVFLAYDKILSRAQQQHKMWTSREESRRLPLACIGGPFLVISLFWLGFTSRASIPFWVPMLAGIPFGMGFVLIFMALLNYLTDAYEIFAASAMAATSCSRSVCGAVLPFAANPLFTRLGIDWGAGLLGFLAAGMCIVPFGFLGWGERLREGSRFCKFLRERKVKEEEALKKEREKGRGESAEIEGEKV